MIPAPHHDGSALYVSDEAPQLGATIMVRLRVPKAWSPDFVGLRWLHDAEGQISPARVLSEEETEVWWEAPLHIRNPRARYRWNLRGGNVGYGWINGTGWHDHDVTDADDFQISTAAAVPEWAKRSVVYQIFPDRFAPSGREIEHPDWAIPRQWHEVPEPRTPQTGQFIYGGDLHGVASKLDHITALGADTLYFTPIFPGRSAHRYDARTYDIVDPLLGGDDALIGLTQEAAAHGLRVIGDLTLNHCGIGHEWFQRAQQDPASPEREFFFFTESSAFGYETWANARTLPKFNLTNTALKDRLVSGKGSILRKWMQAPYNLAGWRIDAANVAGRSRDIDVTLEIAREVRTVLTEERQDALLIAENTQDSSADLAGDGWHGTMNYSAFTRPVWGWLRRTEHILGMGPEIPQITGRQLVATLTDFMAKTPWRSWVASWNYLGCHDNARIRSVVGSAERQLAGLALLVGLPGTPMVFAGDELGLEGDCDDLARSPIPWQSPELWDTATLDAYQQLLNLRRNSTALVDGGLRWVHVADDCLVWLRESTDERLLIAATRSQTADVCIPALPWNIDSVTTVFGESASVHDGVLTLSAATPGASIWRVSP